MDINKILIKELQIKEWQVEATIKLIDEGNTIPFIARYRKEMTGSLSDEVLRKFNERLIYLRNLEAKKEQVITSIEEQGKLTNELKSIISKATTLVEVDDIYRPYRPKRRTRATIAKEKGLEPLAMMIWMQRIDVNIESIAEKYINQEKNVLTVLEAINGAKDILAELVADNADYRKEIRKQTFNNGVIVVKAKDEKVDSVFEMYYEYEEKISKIAPHRILAVNRGEKEKILVVKVEVEQNKILSYLKSKIVIDNEYTNILLDEVIFDSYKRLIAPSIEREIRTYLTEKAEEGAINVFGKNLEQLLMQPPINGKTVLALDPAFRTGCKIAVINSTGKVLDTTVIYPTPPQSKVLQSKEVLKKLISVHNVDVIAIGNGTASRESELFVCDMLKEINKNIHYIIVNEAGASVYSASKLGTEEFPQYDVALRSAVSIGRRLQDPLAELVKIDPKSIGVGQYQHDMNQKKLGEALSGVVEDSVNKVGVDLNTASPSLLQYISGISKAVSKNIVSYRENEIGQFTNRKQLLKVAKLGPKAYQQCAGFLRITDGDNPLDNTGVHPESYDATKLLLKEISKTTSDISNKTIIKISTQVNDLEKMANKLNVGIPTLKDIIKELEKPGRDPRQDMPAPILRTDVLEMKDLEPEMILKGTVRNVIDFGAFIDIGVHQDGLVHISQMSDKYIKHPLEVVSVGDIVSVKILDIDLKKNRISLTMKL